jgi:hypothetical protein
VNERREERRDGRGETISKRIEGRDERERERLNNIVFFYSLVDSLIDVLLVFLSSLFSF